MAAVLAGVVGMLVALFGSVGPAAAAATSVNVAIIGSTASINGGQLPTTDAAFSSFTFTNLAPAGDSAAGLAPFDTAVLNVASTEMGCTTATLSAAAKQALVDFVGSGHKLIIYTSECSTAGTDFSWLPFAFTTNNPGQLGANGTLSIVSPSTLGTTNPADPNFVDAPTIGTQTDAVGDSNVFVSFDPNWFIHMSATNANAVTGPVHTFAEFSSPTPGNLNKGLMIYNGLDIDSLSSGSVPGTSGGIANFAKVWLLELKQSFNPSGLSGTVSVSGITLSPATATNPVGTQHTVTANVSNAAAVPQPNVLVTFTVLSGPNIGASGTCTVNVGCTTSANGNVSFTYTDAGGAGTDQIRACFTNAQNQQACSATVSKIWSNASADTTAPTCAISAVRAGPPKQQDVTVQDTGSGLASITNVVISNGTVNVPAFAPGTTAPVVLTATKTNPAQRTIWSFDATDVAGNSRHCT